VASGEIHDLYRVPLVLDPSRRPCEAGYVRDTQRGSRVNAFGCGGLRMTGMALHEDTRPARVAYRFAVALALALLVGGPAWGAGAPAVPQNVAELWADFDPRAEPLEVDVAAEWADDTGLYQVLRYTIGTFKGTKARMAAFYGRPKVGGKVPGLLHMHGGGQRAFLGVVRYYVGRGYACISVNWGGRPLNEKQPDWPNTDWGAVDPTQSNVPGYASLKPTPKSLVPIASPKNNNWYVLTLACRRALTFLERRPEVDGERLGVFGHSMGGNLTFYVAGTDERVKAAVPSVGGVGFRTHDVPGLPGTARKIDGSAAATALFRRTIASEAYAPHVACPILFLGATNDFNSRMESVYRCYGRLRHQEYRFTFAPHLNHRFLPANEVCRPLWLDAHLKGGFAFPKTPAAELLLNQPDGVPRVRVRPDPAMPVAAVDLYYAIDPDALARFWRDGGARQEGDAWLGSCPVLDLDRPLVAFANVTYRLDRPETLPRGRRVERFCLSSKLLTATPEMLRNAGVKATDRRSLVIDDFARGWRDWYVLEGRNPHHWQFWTRKVSDPKWRGPKGARLALEVKSARENTLVVLVRENEWRRYRGRRKEYVAEAALKGSDQWQEIRLAATDFKHAKDGTPPAAWDEIDQLGLRAYADVAEGGQTVRVGGRWAGPMPEFRLLRWVPK